VTQHTASAALVSAKPEAVSLLAFGRTRSPAAVVIPLDPGERLAANAVARCDAAAEAKRSSGRD